MTSTLARSRAVPQAPSPASEPPEEYRRPRWIRRILHAFAFVPDEAHLHAVRQAQHTTTLRMQSIR